MLKKLLPGMIVCLLTLILAVVVVPVDRAAAQANRSIVPFPRDVGIETIDPTTRTPRSSFCVGVNTIDIKLTNNSEYRQYVSVVNRDASRTERTLYSGWLEPGAHYLSSLLRRQLELPAAGTEMVRVDVDQYGRLIPGNWVSFYVQDCGGPRPGPWPGPGYAQVWARISPYAIEQGKRGRITLQTSVGSQYNARYYFEILNSWRQLWKRIPVSKRPYERYQIILPVGKTTKPGMLTYTVNLWWESGTGGQRRNVATTQFSFRIVTQGSTPTPYAPGYPGYPEYPGWSPDSGAPYYGKPYYGTEPSYGRPSYGMSPYDQSPYGTGYFRGSVNERQVP